MDKTVEKPTTNEGKSTTNEGKSLFGRDDFPLELMAFLDKWFNVNDEIRQGISGIIAHYIKSHKL